MSDTTCLCMGDHCFFASSKRDDSCVLSSNVLTCSQKTAWLNKTICFQHQQRQRRRTIDIFFIFYHSMQGWTVADMLWTTKQALWLDRCWRQPHCQKSQRKKEPDSTVSWKIEHITMHFDTYLHTALKMCHGFHFFQLYVPSQEPEFTACKLHRSSFVLYVLSALVLSITTLLVPQYVVGPSHPIGGPLRYRTTGTR